MVNAMGRIEQITDGLWIATAPVRFAGAWFPHTMTAIRLENGALLLHSPCRPSLQLHDELRALGPVGHVVAPNWFHDLYLREYRLAYPQALFWGPARLRSLKPTLIDRVLTNSTRTPWLSEMAHIQLPGLLAFEECLFFHQPTHTLVIADFLFNLKVQDDTPPFTRLAYNLSGLNGHLAAFPLLRALSVLNRTALRRATSRIFAWDVQRIVVGHGEPINSGAMHALRDALRWLGDPLSATVRRSP
ncbi:DUF4336 domain-containing protein [bacterium]|nr:MAG: DUF4336 domain-containing protein [bacterium]